MVERVSEQGSKNSMIDKLRSLAALRLASVGVLVVFVFFGAFGAWAALAPLDSAAIAPGTVNVLSQRKTLQHLEGGIVTEILVDEGSRVSAGDVVIRLDATQAKIRLDLLQGQLYAAEASAARLEAERDGLDAIQFPEALSALVSEVPKVAKVMTGQQRIFAARKEQLTNRAQILNSRIRQLEEEINGLQAEISTQNRELVLIGEELDSVSSMVAKGVEPRTRLLALKRNAARIEGERAQNKAAIARARQAIGETSLQIDDLDANNLTEVVAELRTVENEIADARERIAAARDILSRTEVIAPVSGVVVNLQVHTTGGVVGPGEPLLDLVPGDDDLIIEARLALTDIDVVHVGLPARVQLTAFNQRSTPSFEGEVRHVSADRIEDRHSGEAYYRLRVELLEGQSDLELLELYPGMPVQVMVRTGERTLLAYLVEPIVDSFGRALKED